MKIDNRYHRILGIESSCDETAAAVVEDGRKVLSNVISSQVPTHTIYGGVVPEIASRQHLDAIDGVILQALKDANVTFDDIDAIAVTDGPGLVGALLVGVSEAKGLAYSLNKPLLGTHHLKGHIAANYITNQDWEPPFLCLVVSGGHSHLVQVEDYGEYRLIGQTADDAAGEALTRRPGSSDCPIPADRGWTRWRRRETRRRLRCRSRKRRAGTITASAG